MYQTYPHLKWQNNDNQIELKHGEIVKLITGHIGKIIMIFHVNNINDEQDECLLNCVSDCDLHKLCKDRNTKFVGLILNKWDYHGHNGHFGCRKWFDAPK